MNRDYQFREYFRQYAAVSLGSEPEQLAEFYDQSFGGNRELGLGAALAVILFVLVIPLVVYNVRQLRLSEDIR